MTLEELEEALQATAPKKYPKTHKEAIKLAHETSIVSDGEVNDFAGKVELLLGECDDDLTVAELRELLHERKMRL